MSVVQFPGRLLKLALASWQKRRRAGELKRYYVKPRADQRNIMARRLDFYGTLLLLWLILLVFLAAIRPLPTALAAASAISLFAGWLAGKMQKKRLLLERHYQQVWTAASRFREKLKQAGSREELAALVFPLLKTLPRFEEVTDKKKGAASPFSRARYLGIPVSVHYLPAGETPAGSAAVQSLLATLPAGKTNNAIFAAAGEFTPDAVRLVNSVKSRFNIALLDERQLVALAGRARQLEGRAKAETQVATPDGTEYTGQAFAGWKQVFFRPRKSRGYLFTGALLLAAYAWLARFTPYAGLYLAFGLVNLVLAVACLAVGRMETAPGLDDWQPRV
ncbi:restriction endonuclease [Desulfotomaculum copahuensis]|uniref:Restriction endonuclease type IV Mrr domain-containing protein n=1 Tax=Desulfotomaculum copahuensis TaxID=1838280 RepID=A0A1B7LH47_9FIRM|nr:restriction endonuclease [Desulfotomaculum copahuensis]OAT85513.1 hypothetical protein A6M21_06260 [Desulfotomaculum copahuensis]